MATLIVGPTSVGKSTYLKRLNEQGDSALTAIASRLRTQPIPEHGYIHYNLLDRFVAQSIDNPALIRGPEALLEAPLLNKIISSGNVAKAVVIVASREEMLAAAQQRNVAETDDPAFYNVKIWTLLLQNVDLFRLYEALFELLDKLAIPYEVLQSCHNNATEPFVHCDRTCVFKILQGKEWSIPSEESIREIVTSPFCEYQTISLPHNIKTTSNYSHLHGRESFLNILPHELYGKSVLDIGAALGGLLIAAERLGARSNVGVELSPKRYKGALLVKKALSSDNTFIQGDFLNSNFDSQFDYVYALNVIHHISDYFTFLRKACSLAKRELVLEYPTVQDKRFAACCNMPENLLKIVNEGPFIGVSSSKVDQTYTFTSKAMDSIITEKIGGFSLKGHRRSSIGQRVVSFYSRIEQ